MQHNNIILIGMMGAGKTTIGSRLAKQLQCQFLDTDQMIESQTKQSINQIFSSKGEPYFRSLEHQTLVALQSHSRCVISTGGGIVISADNRALLKQLGTTIYLNRTLPDLVANLQCNRTRPLLKQGNWQQTVQQLLQTRDHLYREVADIVTPQHLDSPKKIITKILKYCDPKCCH